jgi:hypothetical protein
MARKKTKKPRPGSPAANRQGFIDTYNKANPKAKYGSSGYAKAFTKFGSLGQRRGAAKKVTLGRPPPGTYDPDLDAQERAAQRGYGNTIEDVGRARERASSDFGLGEGEIGRQYGENLSDLIKSRSQGTQDYQTNLQTIARDFSQLGNVQAQRGRQAGLGGGFAMQAQRKRAANEAITRAPVDLGFQRFMEGSKLAETRLGEAKKREAGQLGLGYSRGSEDLSTTQRRAGTELNAYLQDLSVARQAQYGGALPTVKTYGKPKPPPTGRALQAEQRAIKRARRYARKRGRV